MKLRFFGNIFRSFFASTAENGSTHDCTGPTSTRFPVLYLANQEGPARRYSHRDTLNNGSFFFLSLVRWEVPE